MLVALGGSKLASAAAEPPPSPRRVPNFPDVLTSKALRNALVLTAALAFSYFAFQHVRVASFSLDATAAYSVQEPEASTKTRAEGSPPTPTETVQAQAEPLPTQVGAPDGHGLEAVGSQDGSQDDEDEDEDEDGDEDVDAEPDWSRFAYTQYVTESDFLCNSVMLFESLHRLGSPADRVLLYPADMMDPTESDPKGDDARLLVQARDEYSVKLMPIAVQHRESIDKTWTESYTKLLIFNLTEYQRVLHLDSDSTLLDPMDELFLLPPSAVAMPKAYWLEEEEGKNETFTSGVMLVQPSTEEFSRIMDRVDSAGSEDYDMEIMNELYGDTAEVLPHRPYILVSGEFRSPSHGHYLGDPGEEWDASAIFNEAKFVHFSDWPVPKPWRYISPGIKMLHQPRCGGLLQPKDCSGKEIWNWLYDDFISRRKSVCNLEPAKKRPFASDLSKIKSHFRKNKNRKGSQRFESRRANGSFDQRRQATLGEGNSWRS